MKDKSQNKETGKLGEDLAANFLAKKGYQILERNFSSGNVEIDIVCSHQQQIIFVEVKARFNAFIEPEKAVGLAKQKNIARGADAYLNRNKIILPIRFDIISINFFNGKIDIAHFEDAFYPIYYK
ncbi:MAG: YraN family protein [Bacteroidia bacterium]|nr:YraN family protein [Bacteroidia bacterium]